VSVRKHAIGYDIQKSKSKISSCCFCGRTILDEFRLVNLYANRYCHIGCSGFTFSRIEEMDGWVIVVEQIDTIREIRDLVRIR